MLATAIPLRHLHLVWSDLWPSARAGGEALARQARMCLARLLLRGRCAALGQVDERHARGGRRDADHAAAREALPALAGRRQPACASGPADFLASLEAWARSLGCVATGGVGRPGWSRIVKTLRRREDRGRRRRARLGTEDCMSGGATPSQTQQTQSQTQKSAVELQCCAAVLHPALSAARHSGAGRRLQRQPDGARLLSGRDRGAAVAGHAVGDPDALPARRQRLAGGPGRRQQRHEHAQRRLPRPRQATPTLRAPWPPPSSRRPSSS